MPSKRQSQQKQTPNGLWFSPYGDNDPFIGDKLEYKNQYKMAREILLKKDLVKPEELAIMTDSDVEELLDRHFAFVFCRDDTVAIISRADIPALENMLILLNR